LPAETALWWRPRRLAAVAAALTVPATILATQLYLAFRLEGMRVAFAGMLAMQLCHWELWTIAGPFVWQRARRWPLAAPQRKRSFVRHLMLAPLVAAGVLLGTFVLYHALVRLPVLKPWFTGLDTSFRSTAVLFFVSYFHVELLVYAGVVIAAHAVATTALLRARETEGLRLEAELTTAKLKALRMQLQPHFLFNTLHTIGSLVMQRRNRRAVRLLAELGDLLRGTLAHRDTELVPLRDELQHLRQYLRIEQARFGDRLRIQWRIDPAALDSLIPPFILQPLVENAFRHGISQLPDDAILRIGACLENGMLRLVIFNNGVPLPDSFSLDRSTGYGLRNVQERLNAREPPGQLTVANEDDGVTATLIMPAWRAAQAGGS
jgi:two-component system LytT family sensor kinase